ncbi:MAG: hypothetical protein LLG20_16435 [Acidobacteriales bacterium]|nr:hypothetical protein [Terriglobales bacterium]
MEARLDGLLAVRFRDRYVGISECQEPSQTAVNTNAVTAAKRKSPTQPSESARRSLDTLFRSPGPPMWIAAEINRTRTRDALD